MKNNTIIIAVVAVVVILGGAFFAMKGKKSAAPSTPKPTAMAEKKATTSASPAPSAVAGAESNSMADAKVKTIDLEAGSFYFKPDTITVKKGDTVKIKYTNKGGFHNFVIDAFNVNMKPTQGGQTSEVTFTADKAGTFEYYCGVGKHRQMGQKGTLTVEE